MLILTTKNSRPYRLPGALYYFRRIMKPFTIKFTGKPEHKRRHRSRWTGTYIHNYKHKNAEKAEEGIEAQALMQRRSEWPLECPLSVILVVSVKPTKTDSKSKTKFRKMIYWLIFPTKKPDVDNIAKVYLDSLNKVVYKDDKQIVDLLVVKRYAEGEGVEMIVGNPFELNALATFIHSAEIYIP